MGNCLLYDTFAIYIRIKPAIYLAKNGDETTVKQQIGNFVKFARCTKFARMPKLHWNGK